MTAEATRLVLVVDDEPHIARLVGALLGPAYRVAQAQSSAEALSQVDATACERPNPLLRSLAPPCALRRSPDRGAPHHPGAGERRQSGLKNGRIAL